MRTRYSLLILTIVSLLLHSCTSQKKTTLKAPKDIRDRFVQIPEGIAILNADTISVNSFWINNSTR